MSEELKVKRSYVIPENEMVIIKDTNTLLHNIVDSELKEKDKEIERLHSIIKEVREYIENEDNQTKRGIYPNYWYEVKEKDILEILDKGE